MLLHAVQPYHILTVRTIPPDRGMGPNGMDSCITTRKIEL